MSRRRDEWPDAGHARRRLTAWFGGPRDDGDAALTALGDISLLRGQLDHAELAAVRSARAHGRSWTEIATMLGITRHSAWEKWRELDASAAEPGVVLGPRPERIERGGGTGVREPRRLRPVPRAGRAMRDEPSDEAVG